MNNASITRFLIGLFFVFCGTALAQVPGLINYQGLLMTDGGNYPDTTVHITFTIYDAPADGTALWSETQLNVNVAAGLFEVKLGSSTPLSSSVFEGSNRWLGIVVGTSQELYPRVQLVSVPYAMRVNTVDGSSGGIMNGDVAITGKITVGEGALNDAKGAVVMGDGNVASGEYATNVGGQFNNVSANLGSSIGGSGNQVAGQYGFIGGGIANIADGFGSFVAGGNTNYATGMYSFAAGNQARALHNGSLVFSANDCPT